MSPSREVRKLGRGRIFRKQACRRLRGGLRLGSLGDLRTHDTPGSHPRSVQILDRGAYVQKRRRHTMMCTVQEGLRRHICDRERTGATLARRQRPVILARVSARRAVVREDRVSVAESSLR
jgi:hypothetical protein